MLFRSPGPKLSATVPRNGFYNAPLHLPQGDEHERQPTSKTSENPHSGIQKNAALRSECKRLLENAALGYAGHRAEKIRQLNQVRRLKGLTDQSGI